MGGCRPDCGACCVSIDVGGWEGRLPAFHAWLTQKLQNPYLAGQQRHEFATLAAMLQPHPTKPSKAACNRYDAQARRCTRHGDRPDMCRHYPHYGNPQPKAPLNLMCGFMAEVRTVLPLVEIR